MASLKLSVPIFLVVCVLLVHGGPVKQAGSLNALEGSGDQLTSGTDAKGVVPEGAANAKGDLKGSDSFGLGYYLPIVTPIVKYHYPLVYYPTYLHSIRHHGYGGYGFFHHGHGVIH